MKAGKAQTVTNPPIVSQLQMVPVPVAETTTVVDTTTVAGTTTAADTSTAVDTTTVADTTTAAKQAGGYKPTERNLYYLRKYKRGESIGFTLKASLKAKGLLPRESRKFRGRKIISEKYRGRK